MFLRTSPLGTAHGCTKFMFALNRDQIEEKCTLCRYETPSVVAIDCSEKMLFSVYVACLGCERLTSGELTFRSSHIGLGFQCSRSSRSGECQPKSAGNGSAGNPIRVALPGSSRSRYPIVGPLSNRAGKIPHMLHCRTPDHFLPDSRPFVSAICLKLMTSSLAR